MVVGRGTGVSLVVPGRAPEALPVLCGAGAEPGSWDADTRRFLPDRCPRTLFDEPDIATWKMGNALRNFIHCDYLLVTNEYSKELFDRAYLCQVVNYVVAI